jgi:pimeloyl-ACP methyl ester carboxylesterase
VWGHGWSEAPEAGYTWENYAADLRDLLDHLGEDRAHVVGLSMGGGIALQFALDHPERTYSVNAIDSALPGYAYSSEMSDAIQRLQETIRREGPHPAFEEIWLAHPMFNSIRRFPDKLAKLREMMQGFPARDYLAEPEPPHEPQVIDRLHELRVHALVMVGELDLPDFQTIAMILAENVPNANHLVIADAGHVANMEQPDQVNTALIDFFHNAMTGLIDPRR